MGGRGGVDKNKYLLDENGNKYLLTEELTIAYDKNQFVSEKKSTIGSYYAGIRWIKKIENDKNGNVIVNENFDGENVLQETKKNSYIFDSIGNWTERIESINGNQKFISIRTIKYFER